MEPASVSAVANGVVDTGVVGTRGSLSCPSAMEKGFMIACCGARK